MPDPAMADTPVVAILGRGVMPAGDVQISADDLGFTRGDGCFDAARVVTDADGASVVDLLDEHLARLAWSAASLGLPPPDLDAWRDLVAVALAAWRRPGEAVLKLVLTRGLENAPSPPTSLLTLSPMDRHAIETRSGISVVTLSRGHPSDAFEDAPWLLGGVKTLSYAANLAARREAVARGADDALFVSTDGFALEGPNSTLLWRQDGALASTRLDGTGVLASVTVAALFAAARRRGERAERRLIRAAELPATHGAWLVSAGRGVCPILRLDGAAMPHDPALTAVLAASVGF